MERLPNLGNPYLVVEALEREKRKRKERKEREKEREEKEEKRGKTFSFVDLYL